MTKYTLILKHLYDEGEDVAIATYTAAACRLAFKWYYHKLHNMAPWDHEVKALEIYRGGHQIKSQMIYD